jgi:hypothetical protein
VQHVEVDDPGGDLVRAVEACVSGWVERCVTATAEQQGVAVTAELREAARAAGVRAREEVIERLSALVSCDVDEQRTNPLSILRDAVRHPTAVLVAAGVPPVRRDEFVQRAFPDDIYGLCPATWSDVDPSLYEPGIVWGAWKAKAALDRRR